MPGYKPRYWISSVYLLFLLIGIPWYWPHDWDRLLWGIPVWVIVTVMVSFLASLFTAWVFLFSTTGPSDTAE